jgi:arginine repressor
MEAKGYSKNEADYLLYCRIVRDVILSISCSGTLIVFQTLPASARVVAHVLDAIHWPEVLGAVADANTVLVAVRPESITEEVAARLRKLLFVFDQDS